MSDQCYLGTNTTTASIMEKNVVQQSDDKLAAQKVLSRRSWQGDVDPPQLEEIASV